MGSKSTNIFAVIAMACSTSACMQELVEKQHVATVAGYDHNKVSDDSSVFAVNNTGTGSVRQQAANTIPVLYSDPFAVGKSNTPASPSQAPVTAYAALPPVTYQQPVAEMQNSAYGSLAAAPQGTFSPNILMQNNSPTYQQPVYGYAPLRPAY